MTRVSRPVITAIAALIAAASTTVAMPEAMARPAPTDLAALTGTIAQRLATADTVAAAKRRTGAAVDDPARESEVIAAAVTTGRTAGVDPARVQTVVRDQIEVGKAVQRTLLTLWRTIPSTSPTAPANLAVVRSRITALTRDLVTGLARDDAALRGPSCPIDVARAAAVTTATQRLDPLHAVALAAASKSLCRD